MPLLMVDPQLTDSLQNTHKLTTSIFFSLSGHPPPLSFLSSVIHFVEQAVTYENESDKLLVQTAKNTSLLPLSALALISSVALFEQDSLFRFFVCDTFVNPAAQIEKTGGTCSATVQEMHSPIPVKLTVLFVQFIQNRV